MRKFLPLAVGVLLMTGCAVDPVTALVTGGATVATYSVTGKSPVDYGLSRARHQDCDIRNPKRHNGAYCVDTPPPAPPEASVYCYPTLGVPYCSRQLDPYRNGNQPLDGSGAGVIVAARPATEEARPVALTPTTTATPGTAPQTPSRPAPARDPALQGS